jgi:DNA repair protein RadD
MIILRPYQEKGIVDIRGLFQKGHRKVCYTAPTASGKTVLFCHLANKITAAGQRVAVIVHRQELVDQTCKALTEEGLEFGTIAAGFPERSDASVLVAMAQTLVNRLDRLAGIAYLVVDEAHHVVAATWRAILVGAPNVRVLGVTATPERLDGAGLREAFEALALGPTVKELIAAGWLAPFTVYAPERLVNLKGARTVAGDYAVGDLARRMSADFVSGIEAW